MSELCQKYCIKLCLSESLLWSIRIPGIPICSPVAPYWQVLNIDMILLCMCRVTRQPHYVTSGPSTPLTKFDYRRHRCTYETRFWSGWVNFVLGEILIGCCLNRWWHYLLFSAAHFYAISEQSDVTSEHIAPYGLIIIITGGQGWMISGFAPQTMNNHIIMFSFHCHFYQGLSLINI